MTHQTTSPTIDFLWFDGCPHHVAARALLDDVLAASGVVSEIQVVEVADDETARRVRFPGSPTIRMNGRDIDPGYVDPGEYAPGCRVYATSAGLRGVPERAWLEAALAGASRETAVS